MTKTYHKAMTGSVPLCSLMCSSHDLDISSGSRTLGASKLARAFGARPSASRSVYSVYFWGFCPFQFFILPMYRAITKNISESTCGKSNRSSGQKHMVTLIRQKRKIFLRNTIYRIVLWEGGKFDIRILSQDKLHHNTWYHQNFPVTRVVLVSNVLFT